MRRKTAAFEVPAPLAYHLTLHTRGDRPLFRCPGLAWTVLASLAAQRRTEAACLLPHRLEWLVAGGSAPARLVAVFKRACTRRAWRLGHEGALWDGEDLIRPLRSEAALRAVNGWVAELPAASGLTLRPEEYPYRVRRASRPARTSIPRAVTAGSTAV